MAISLSSLRKLKADKPARILIYGEPKIGKTTLASEFPNPVFIQLEDGTPQGIEPAGWDREEIKTFGDVIEAMAALAVDDHPFQTLVIDSMSELQKLVFAETCARGDDKGNAKNNIEDFGYGKGYVYAQRVMQEFIEAFNELRVMRGMMIVLVAHSITERFDDPETTSYSRYEIAMHAKLVGMIEAEVDAILLLKSDVSVKTEEQGFNKERAIAQGGANTFIYADGRAAYTAGNRFGIKPKIKYELGKGFEALAPYLPALPARATDKAA